MKDPIVTVDADGWKACAGGQRRRNALDDGRARHSGWSRRSVPRSVRLDAGDVGGEEVDAVAVEVAAGAVVVLGGSRIGMSSEDLRVTQRDPGVEGVGDRRVSQRVRAWC